MRCHQVALLLALLSLAGCATPMAVNTITRIAPTNGATGIDIYENRRRNGEEVPKFAGDQLVEVRTYALTEGGGRGEEFKGAQCKLEARDYAATLMSPAKVRVPIYQYKSSTLAVSCTHADYESKLVEMAVFNKTRQQRMSSASAGGVIGVVAMIAVNALTPEENDDFAYQHAILVMKPLKKTAAKN